MQNPVKIPAIWVYSTDAVYNTVRPEGYGAFLSPDQSARLERIRQARLLFDGQHRKYYLDESRSQYDWPPMRIGDRMIQPFITFNVLRLISWKGADLLFGAEPLLRVDNDQQQGALSELVDRSSLHQLFYAKAVDASYEGEAFVEACILNNQAYLRDLPADEVFPVGAIQPDGQFNQYDRLRAQNIGTEQAKIWVLLKESYLPGSIERHVYQLDDEGKIAREIALDQWPLADGQSPLEAITRTGIDRNTITWIPNQLMRGQVVSDYDGALDLQDQLNAKQTQIGRVLAKHADPKLAISADNADDQGQLRAGYDVFFYRDPANIPKYLTWAGAEVQHAQADRDFTLNALLMLAEMSPILLGIKQPGSHAEAFKTIRVQAYNSVTKAARKASFWKNGIKRCIGVAQDLEQTIPGQRYDRMPITVELRDGLPIDDLDQAKRQSILRAAGLLSIHRALQEQMNDPVAVEAEEDELARENAAKTPSIFLGQGTPGGLEATEEQPGDEETAADAAEQDMEVAA